MFPGVPRRSQAFPGILSRARIGARAIINIGCALPREAAWCQSGAAITPRAWCQSGAAITPRAWCQSGAYTTLGEFRVDGLY